MCLKCESAFSIVHDCKTSNYAKVRLQLYSCSCLTLAMSVMVLALSISFRWSILTLRNLQNIKLKTLLSQLMIQFRYASDVWWCLSVPSCQAIVFKKTNWNWDAWQYKLHWWVTPLRGPLAIKSVSLNRLVVRKRQKLAISIRRWWSKHCR